MININIVELEEAIKVYNCGVLILEENSYTNIVLTIKEALTIIEDDLYQVNVLKSILQSIEDIKGMVA